MKSQRLFYLPVVLFIMGALPVSSCAGADSGAAPKSAAPEMPLTRMTGATLRQWVTGNTIEGTVVVGRNGRHHFPDNKFREYHAPDGQIWGFADNGREIFKNTNTCWEIRNDEVCYTNYSDLQGHCSQYFKTGKPNEILGIATDTPDVFMIGKVEKGNPGNLTDYGVKWTCQKP
jgi:hypothetical protein